MRCEFLIFFFSFFGGIGKNFNLDFVENRSKIFHTMEIIILEGRCNRFFFFHFAILLYRSMVTLAERIFINSLKKKKNEFFRTTD